MQRLRASIVLAFVFAFSMALSFAQTSNGTISGTVVDPSGAAIANAKVTAKSVQTGNVRTTTTNGVGGYRLESLIPGTYTITVNAEGFSKREIQNVGVAASLITSVNANMVVGSETVVSVEATGETLQTETGELSETIGSTEVHELPIASLNAYALATTLPGVTTVRTADFTEGTSYSVNGSRPRSNNFLIEGTDNNDAGIHGQGLTPENLDAIKEVSVLTNSYSAEFGHGGASVSNLIFKNGSNEFHGAGWDLLQNSSLDAIDKSIYTFSNDPAADKTKSRENIFGFDLGGPIVKDKLFFFGSYQWDKYRATAVTSPVTIPTANGVAALQALNNTTPNARITNLLSAIGPLRGTSNTHFETLSDGTQVEFGDAVRSGLGTQAEAPEFDAKGDYLITSKDTLSFRYIRNHYSTPYDFSNYPNQLPGFDTEQSGVSHNAGVTYTRIFSPKIVNELRLSYGRIGFSFLPRPDTTNRADGLGVAPTVTVSGLFSYGAPSAVPQGRFHNTYQIQDSVSWQKGNHVFKFGADIADIRVVDQIPYNFYGAIGYAGKGGFSAFANYVDDFGGASTTVSRTFGSPTVRPEMKSQNYFIQDSWKLKSNLTVDLGIRYEYDGTPANTLAFPAMNENDPFAACYPTCRIPQVGDKNNWGPRVGFAYTPHFLQSLFGNNKTVLRGGFGVFYDNVFTNILDNTQAATPNSIAASRSSSGTRGTANWSQVFATLSPTFSPFATQTSMDANLKSPKTLQWNLNVQRELPGSFVATIGYVGTRGEHLYGQNYLNPLDPNTGNFLNPSRGFILARDNSGDSIYHGLNAELQRKFAKGLMFRAAYTYSKAIDDVSEVFTSGNWSAYPAVQMPNWAAGENRGTFDRGLSAFDIRQRLSLSYVYDIPNIKADGYFKPLTYLTNGWSVSGTTAFQAGNPANVEVGYDVNGDGITNDRPNLGNPAAPINTYGWDSSWEGLPSGQVCAGPEYWVGPCTPVAADSVHWIVPAYGTAGNVGRNSITTPGTQLWNFSIARRFRIHESHQFEFRTDLFNAFNHGNTGTPSYSLVTGIPTNGTVKFANYPLSVEGGRNIRFWLKYSF
jgi:hypothetical protein